MPLLLCWGGGLRLDLVLLGMGDDGHTASLFPGTLDLIPDDRLVIAHWVPKVQMMRITFTPLLINAAENVLFMVTGRAKAELLARVLYGPRQPDVLPAQLIEHAEWWVDAAAASAMRPWARSPSSPASSPTGCWTRRASRSKSTRRTSSIPISGASPPRRPRRPGPPAALPPARNRNAAMPPGP